MPTTTPPPASCHGLEIDHFQHHEHPSVIIRAGGLSCYLKPREARELAHELIEAAEAATALPVAHVSEVA